MASRKGTTLFWTQTLRMDKVDKRTIEEVDELMKEITQEDLEQSSSKYEPGTIVCTDCSEQFKHPREAHLHWQSKHEKKREYRCTICHIVVEQEGVLSNHLSNVHGIQRGKSAPRRFRCRYCNYSCNQWGHMDRHLEYVHQNKNWRCHQCKLSLPSQEALYNHYRTHPLKKHACTECPLTFSTTTQLNSHITTHTHTRSHYCDVCGRGFSLKHTLSRHMVIHMKQRRHVCALCGVRNYTSEDFKKHRCSNHIPGKFQCPLCVLSFDTRYRLNMHKLHIHNLGIKRKQKSHVVSRIVECLNNGDYKVVTEPDDPVETKDNILPVQELPILTPLKEEEDSKHNVLKIFKCPVCNEVFKTRYRLNGHKLKFHSSLNQHAKQNVGTVPLNNPGCHNGEGINVSKNIVLIFGKNGEGVTTPESAAVPKVERKHNSGINRNMWKSLKFSHSNYPNFCTYIPKFED